MQKKRQKKKGSLSRNGGVRISHHYLGGVVGLGLLNPRFGAIDGRHLLFDKRTEVFSGYLVGCGLLRFFGQKTKWLQKKKGQLSHDGAT